MNLAIKKAWQYQGLTYPNPAVGALVLDKNKKILAIKAHKKAGSSHAELLALKKAYVKLSKDKLIKDIKDPFLLNEYLIKNSKDIFKNCSLYTSLEPCSHRGKTPSCAKLIKSLALKKVFISNMDKKRDGLKILKENNTIIKKGILEKKGKKLLKPFLLWEKKNFVVFKWAADLNANISGKISSKKSRKFVHKIRDKIDLIVIGGNTLRKDRPTLDARLCNGKAPDVLIYSKKNNFDKNIKLFKVKNRKVIISDNLDLINNYNFVMIEGVGELLEKTKKYVDYYLSFISPKINNGNRLSKYKEDFKIIHTNKISKDIILWAEKK